MDILNRKIIFDKTGGKCFYCGCDLDFKNFHVDHLTPKSAGGKDARNTFPSFPECNIFKSNKTLEEFRYDLENIGKRNMTGKLMIEYWGAKKPKILFWFERNETPKK